MMILPPIIIKVVVSKFFTESIRFETFEVISVGGLLPGDCVVVEGLSTGGSEVVVIGICAYWEGKVVIVF